MKKPKVSIKDVALAAGVSRAAVSLVLNDGKIRIGAEKRQRIIDVSKEMGYTPHIGARRLALRKMETIGLIFVDKPNALNEQYLFSLTHAIAHAAREFGYDLHLRFLGTGDRESAPITPGLVDGSLIVAGKSTQQSFFDHFSNVSHPYVVLGGGFMNPKPPDFVDVDVSTGMMMATRHLIQLGHRRIAFVSGSSNEDKLNGYIVGLTKSKVGIRRDLILEDRQTDRELDEVVQTLLTLHEPPTGIVCTSDWLAVRLMRSFKEAGQVVPRDISITGFDNSQIADLVSPPLTTVKVPSERIAQLAVRQLVRMIDGPTDSRLQSMLPAELVIRESTVSTPGATTAAGGLSTVRPS